MPSGSGDTAVSAEAVVRTFCDTVGTRDIERLRPFLAPDVVYHNMSMEPSKGIDATLEALATLFAMFESVSFEMVNVAVIGDTVLTERVDVLRTAEATAPLPVMGTFEVEGGRIVAWRDYFDVTQAGRLLNGA
jgi:limonene-1,2-epoxide hydrolase